MKRPEDGRNVWEEGSGSRHLSSLHTLSIFPSHQWVIEVQQAGEGMTNLPVVRRVQQKLPVSITTSLIGATSLTWTCRVSYTGILSRTS